MDRRKIPRVTPPSPDEIRRACRAIQRTWTVQEERLRRVNSRRLVDGDRLVLWTVPIISIDDIDDSVIETPSQ